MDEEYYKKAVVLMESLLERDDIKKWIKEAEAIPEDFINERDKMEAIGTCTITTSKSFEDLWTHHNSLMMAYFLEMIRFHKLMWICQHNFDMTIKEYLKHRDKIKNPDMLKVIDGYKEFKEKEYIDKS